MSRRGYFAGVLVAAAAVGAGAFVWLHHSPDAVLEDRWALLGEYCTGCHNDAELTAELSLEHVLPKDVVRDAELWEAAIKKLTLGTMPPRDEPQPDPRARAELVAALEAKLDAAADARPHAGRYPRHSPRHRSCSSVI